jgi:hypothetical protein
VIEGALTKPFAVADLQRKVATAVAAKGGAR